MPIEREIYTEKPARDRDVIVTNTDRTDGGSSVATTMLAVIGIVIVLVVGFFVIQALSGDSDGTVFPDNVDVNIQDDGGSVEQAPAPADPAPADPAPATTP